ncbi:MAG: response regulator [Ardenticatenaceae bacterium]|nr:response regulator [Anaerolineales bacterium]MCB8921123.1 response regulator [Ardenticatenaceae bacterium]MCB8990828.1 response regulator [Ardenticatenaceae bacterium]MCB9004478.1 response regulator [Ardenticatenaceae bacterium]
MPSVLVIDDDIEIRHMMGMLLDFEGWETIIASDGVEALAILEQQLPDIILLDVMMPRMNGILFCRELRNNEKTADIPVIILSGKTTAEAIAEGMDAGANLYLTKPTSPQKILGYLKELLGDSSNGKAP